MNKEILSSYSQGFQYLHGKLHCEEVSIKELVAEYGSPVLVYSSKAIINQVRALQSNHYQLHYAVKANSNIHLLNLLSHLGLGMDVVSSGEVFRCSVAGIESKKIVFSGVGKTERELQEAIEAEIFMFNVESSSEFWLLNKLAGQSQIQQAPKVSLRVNPNIDPKTHPYISTGLRDNKFGFSPDELKKFLKDLKNSKQKIHLNLCGLSSHIGSQILDFSPFKQSWQFLIDLSKQMPFKVEYLNLGGGIGIRYHSEKHLSLEKFKSEVERFFKKTSFKLSIEPGRSIIGPCGILVSKIVHIKERKNKRFYIVDAGMNDLIRPALYKAIHPIFTEKLSTQKLLKADIVGPVCESSDVFLKGTKLPHLQSGELLCFGNAGAYTMSMSSQYNSRPRIAEVLVEGSTHKLIKSRETYADLIRHELF